MRVYTPDGPGVVKESDSRQGTTWWYIEGAAMTGWYPAHQVTADIGDGQVTSPDEFPDAASGTTLPYDPKPRDVFHDQKTIQPIADLPENLDPTPSIQGLRDIPPNEVFASHPFGKEVNARHHFSDTETSDDDDSNNVTDGTSDDPYPHVPKDWDEKKNPGLSDYGPDYDDKNPLLHNPFDHDYGPFKTSDIDRDLPADWNYIPGDEELDHPFSRDRDENDDDEDFHREAAGLDALNAPDEDQMSLGDMLDPQNQQNPQQQNPMQQVPWDPSHSMTPDGQMAVMSPDQQQMQNHDHDPAGMLQNVLQQVPDDDLQGIPVPHEMDADDELAGVPVPHNPLGQSPGQGPIDQGELGTLDDVDALGQTGNMPVNPEELAGMAQNFLARTAAKNYTDSEQTLLMNESGVASQLASLHLGDSIYEEEDPMFLL